MVLLLSYFLLRYVGTMCVLPFTHLLYVRTSSVAYSTQTPSTGTHSCSGPTSEHLLRQHGDAMWIGRDLDGSCGTSYLLTVKLILPVSSSYPDLTNPIIQRCIIRIVYYDRIIHNTRGDSVYYTTLTIHILWIVEHHSWVTLQLTICPYGCTAVRLSVPSTVDIWECQACFSH